ncbi:uncharacterized protein BO97DRAFT_129131 [Aspergillus homomorphus CBS 101889]|uniref:Uncharacterized protein n=1 Tax=Aspergillus homomorphus (strain CBS 101889) TaxID=1450537 RepID=A0A395I903_ASPHC|nr:hypothetical protein BO97DRAFT_129131 [Aspergillus homomorphus CBS 101889]RAL16259.1 hypothetical protein BO97DRAFT_129131 [Aspergillus homomorphus CBS 101889]
MKQGENTVSASHSSSFQTPDKPTSGARLSTTANAANGQLKCDLSSSSSLSERLYKRKPLPSTLDQTTLTQIDFVTPTPQPSRSDESLQYLDGKQPQPGQRNGREVIDLDDDSNNDGDLRLPSGRQSRRARGVRFEQNPSDASSKQFKTPRQREVDTKPKRRKIGTGVKSHKLDKDAKKGNKTLTQMDYVRRYLKIEPDDEVKLEYTYTTPKKSDRKQANRHVSDTFALQPDHFSDQEASSGGKKRKLSMTADTKVKLDTEEPLDPGSVTPRAKREREIPSSQSPQSSSLAVITSSQFRTATRTPQKHDADDIPGRCIKQESPFLRRIKGEASQSPMREIPDSNETLPSTVVPDSPLPCNTVCEGTGIAQLSEHLKSEKHDEPHAISEHVPTTQRTVVYETDAETDTDTDYGDLETDLPNPMETLRKRRVPHYDPGAVNLEHEDASEESSQALPPVTAPEMEEELEQPLLDDNPTSDASIYYQRIQPATQFPLGPVPNLNTQRLAELFPDDLNDESIATMSLTESSSRTPKRMSNASDTNGLDHDPHKSTEIVPESSPIVRQDDGGRASFRTPAQRLASRDIVQVESSQPADRHRTRSQGQDDSGPRGIFRKSDLLTSSVMESIPMPMFLLDSQDSIGEPYSSQQGS